MGCGANPHFRFHSYIKLKVGNDQEMAQSERNSHSKTEVGKTKLTDICIP